MSWAWKNLTRLVVSSPFFLLPAGKVTDEAEEEEEARQLSRYQYFVKDEPTKTLALLLHQVPT